MADFSLHSCVAWCRVARWPTVALDSGNGSIWNVLAVLAVFLLGQFVVQDSSVMTPGGALWCPAETPAWTSVKPSSLTLTPAGLRPQEYRSFSKWALQL